MRRNNGFLIAALCILLHSLIFPSIVSSQGRGKIAGKVTDAATGDPLGGANIYLAGTAMGAATDLNGDFVIWSVPPGRFTLRATYIGYQQKEIEIQVGSNQTLEQNISLAYDVVEGETVVITAQAEGQVAAINQQLRSNTITNVVSQERIMEFPDVNAAESVGRLPGISIQRSGGEASRIVIRGLSPTYNLITIGGERIPATDLDDRSVDLNMISPEILSGIEITKAITPDKDADTFGGTVDFELAEAPSGGFRYNFRGQTGYNNHRTELGQYKGSLTVSNRYFDEKLGIMVTGNMERAQRGSDQFTATYVLAREKREGEEFAPISVGNVEFNLGDEVRKRLGFSLLMDYKLPGGRLMFSNFLSRLDRDELIFTHLFQGESNFNDYRFNDRKRQIDVLSNSLSGEHSLLFFTMDWRLSRTESLTRHPYVSRISFRERGGFDTGQFRDVMGPDILINSAYNNLENTNMQNGNFTTEKSLERDLSAQVNIQIPYTLSRNMAGFVKLGGKIRDKIKNRDRYQRDHRLDNTNLNYERHHTRYGEPGFEFKRLLENGWSSIQNYIDPDFSSEGWLDGRHEFGPGFLTDELNHLVDTYLLDSLYTGSSLADLDDFETDEQVTSGYIMTEFNIGRMFMLLPGVRYEWTHNDLTGRQGTLGSISGDDPELNNPAVTDTSAVTWYGRWFPMMHFRIRPAGFFDIRLAYTKSLSRPRLDWMIPKRRINANARVAYFGAPDLLPQISNNYDVFLSLYSNTIGLITVGGFYKKIDELIFERNGHKILNALAEGYDKALQGYVLDKPENNAYKTELKGVEIEWQTNLHWLPKPFDGIVINANYSHIWSETTFPRSFVVQEKIPVYPFVKTSVLDTFRTGRMPDQANDIANISVGYDKGPFSVRASMLYQGNTLYSIGERLELDGFTADLLRFDVSGKITITRNLSFFLNFNNITNEPDESFQQASSYLTASEYYGWTTDIGIGYQFN